ncbi:MAG: hypothetical protein IMF09_12430 [Proteobacteria bacterium]|nr:hypothetical protein [Pseudomonadota bacterium]
MQRKPTAGISILAPGLYAALLALFIFPATQAVAGDGPKGPEHRYRNPGYSNQDGYNSENAYGIKNLAYYGDWDSNRVFIIDVDEMSLVTIVENTGDGPYGIDQQGSTKAYALTRKTESLTVVDNYEIENAGEIPLEHKPRSTHFNSNTGLTLVAGADKVMTSIIRVKHDKVVKVMGYTELAQPHDYGGSLATGHPMWVDDERFLMLDRDEREIQLWDRRGKLLSVLETPTSVHHVFQSPLDMQKNKMTFYAVAEGNRDELVSPSILRFKIHRGKMRISGEAVLSEYDTEVLDVTIMGSHHADFHPDGVHIYIGSAEGHVFVVNKNTMKIITMIDTGKGSGHTTFIPMHDLAIVTNHNDTHMTVIDTVEHKKLQDIEVASSADPTYKSQSHTSGVSADMQYFYSAASHDGEFFEIDLNTLEVSRRVYLGGNVLMGSFIWDGDAENM